MQGTASAPKGTADDNLDQHGLGPRRVSVWGVESGSEGTDHSTQSIWERKEWELGPTRTPKQGAVAERNENIRWGNQTRRAEEIRAAL